MNMMEFQLHGVSDPRLAVHATTALPAWLWSTDGSRILWANPVGAELFGAATGAELANRTFGPADPHRRQIAHLATRLPPNAATRLERLRGFGARPGMLATCACARLAFFDGSHGVLIAPVESTKSNMPQLERLQRLVASIAAPVAVFSRDGTLSAASDAARPLLSFGSLAEAGLDEARHAALHAGRVETPTEIGNMVLQRIGSGADTALVALITPPVAPEPPEDIAELQVEAPPAYEQPALSGEAPAEFALFDAFTEQSPEQTAQAEAAQPRPAPETPTTDAEPSSYVEAIADEPAVPPDATAPDEPDEAPAAPPSVAAWRDVPVSEPRQQPLRFVWAMDEKSRFTVMSEEFIALAGRPTAARLGRSWGAIAAALGLDPEAQVMKAFATHDTWSGITLNWPVEDGGSLAVELAGLPVYDRTQRFDGFRGFGVCRELDALAQLAAFRSARLTQPAQVAPAPAVDIVPADSEHAPAQVPPVEPDVIPGPPGESAASGVETSTPTDLEATVDTPPPAETPPNVVPFRPLGSEPKAPGLTAGENNAFNELARQLSARLERDGPAEPAVAGAAPAMAEPAVAEAPQPVHEPKTPTPNQPAGQPASQPASQPEWLMLPEPPARGDSGRDRMLLDLLPTGVLIYRLDRMLYANPAFLERMGYPSLHALEQAGGLDALYVEPGVSTSTSSSSSEAGTPVTIAASQPAAEHATPTEARLFTISWDGESALALMFAHAPSATAAAAPVAPLPLPVLVPPPPPAGQANAEDLAAILDTTAEGILMFDASGNIHACNRSAEALFGYASDALTKRNLTELFAPESHRVVLDYLESIKDDGASSLLDAGRDVLGRVSQGGIIPLSMTMGRTRADGPNFFAVFRDQSQSRKGDSELREARKLAERAATAKADMLARISHEVRAPLNAIIGFAEVMIGERFGPLANERYAEYLKDIRASGERVTTIINDLTELSRIETGKLDLAFTSQNLNELVESCVSVMQPQANRERIIIRTSLAHLLPPVVADARSLRQITMNLIGNSIHLANPGGQVIVSTALSDYGEVVLRVRDTGHGLNDNEVAAALEPFRTPPPSDKANEKSGLNLSLTKALVEANRAQFHIKTGGRSGTLVEIVFARALARA
ncbi:PAS domain-containing protein [Bradyrhizobium sp. Tv2a-2]|uniref:PAS domain-containing protein n=1 Tax=Bradyrhizobium sp. Tv2a-2 TaxID=113395 RepID=UPI000411210E|nr:PAS domain-containing protein [Bradyrhizobium sp. Tv2a-2]